MNFSSDFDKLRSSLNYVRRIYEHSYVADNGRLMSWDKDLTDAVMQGVTKTLISIEALKPCGRSFKVSTFSGVDAYGNKTYTHKVLSTEELLTYLNTGLVDNRTPDNIYPVNRYEVLLPTYEDFVNKIKNEILSALS